MTPTIIWYLNCPLRRPVHSITNPFGHQFTFNGPRSSEEVVREHHKFGSVGPIAQKHMLDAVIASNGRVTSQLLLRGAAHPSANDHQHTQRHCCCLGVGIHWNIFMGHKSVSWVVLPRIQNELHGANYERHWRLRNLQLTASLISFLDNCEWGKM